ncbi:MAG: phosphate signaling complex protein PhoU [Dongiaceae bacterium]
MAVETQHIVKSFDEELQKLRQTVAQMGGLVEAQLQAAVDALVKRDAEAAAKVVRDDARIDELEQQLGNMVIRLLALRQPMAVDLRQIVSALKISSDLERIGDYAANVAKRAIALSQQPMVRPVHAIPRMARLVQQIIKDVLDSYVEQDVAKAIAAWQRDEEVDEMYTSLFRELLTYMMEDPRNITPCTHLLFIAKNIERIGDHSTNIAETIYFLVHGKPLEAVRPKGDKSSFAVVTPATGDAPGGGHGRGA